jgi:metal-dependent amidase/aminoacylase/carboxypeptidase family protein
MEDRGWEVTRHYKMDTAWRAAFTYKSNNAAHAHKSARVLGVNSEMDALPVCPVGLMFNSELTLYQGIGHACGHNLIAIAGVGVALAVRAALEKHDIPGTVVLLGTPGTFSSPLSSLTFR